MALLPAGLHGLGWPSFYPDDSPDLNLSVCEFQLHPHYRMARPLDSLLLKANAGLDDFVTEKYADEIAAILAGGLRACWNLRKIVSAIARVLYAEICGSFITACQIPYCAPAPGD